MNIQEIRDHIVQAQSHLSIYLDALRDSSNKQEIILKSRWPWKGRVVSAYPSSFGQKISLFFQTLHFDFLREAQHQFLEYVIESLNLYQQAIQYEVLASKPKALYLEQEGLIHFQNWLVQLSQQLKNREELSDDEKEAVYEWMGRLTDVHVSSDIVTLLQRLLINEPSARESVMNNLKALIQERMTQIPQLVSKAVQDAENFFKEHGPVGERSATMKNTAAVSDSLFNFFIKEEPLPEMDALYKQVETASKIWRQVEQNVSSKTYRAPLEHFAQFFRKLGKEYDFSWDIHNGVAYADLFFRSRPSIFSQLNQSIKLFWAMSLYRLHLRKHIN